MDGTDLNCINQVNNISLGENVSGQHSTVLNIACGIPQGSQGPALGPKSFALYTNDLPNAVTSGCALNTAAASNEDRFLAKLCCWCMRRRYHDYWIGSSGWNILVFWALLFLISGIWWTIKRRTSRGLSEGDEMVHLENSKGSLLLASIKLTESESRCLKPTPPQTFLIRPDTISVAQHRHQ